MEEKRKIVIPIGAKPDLPSEETFFDTEATRAARRVVPLSGQKTGAAAKGSRGRRLMLVVVFGAVAAVAAVATGSYLYFFRGSGQSEPLASVRPVASKSFSVLPWTHTPEEPVVEENVAATTEKTDEAKETTQNETEARNDRVADARDQKKPNKKERVKAKKKNEDDLPEDPTKRTQDELNRIREIFEGPPE